MARKERIRVRDLAAENMHGDPASLKPWRNVDGAVVVPRSSGDFEQRGPIILSGYMVVLPGSVAIKDTDEVEIRGELQQIDGSVGDYTKRKIFYTRRVN